MCFIEQIFTQLLFHPPTQKVFHVPSSSKLHYRNKITYGCAQETKTVSGEAITLQRFCSCGSCGSCSLCNKAAIYIGNSSAEPNKERHVSKQTEILHFSNLAEDYVNDICFTIVEFWRTFMDMQQTDDNSSKANVLLREMMVKGTRSADRIIIRLTLQFLDGQDDPTLSTNSSSKWEDGPFFYKFIAEKYNDKEFCICYNSMVRDNARPMKDRTQLYFLTPETPYVLEYTPNGYIYQISPDTFSEVNHEVELLQWDQTKIWIEELYLTLPNRACDNDVALLVSGRDISAFALGYGTLKVPRDACICRDSSSSDNRHDSGSFVTCTCTSEFMFPNVIAVQHCPLVHHDAMQNVQRYVKEHGAVPNFEVLHSSKATMVHAIHKVFSERLCTISSLFTVMTGGRKGLDPSYVNFLNQHKFMKGIIYNSCATKSLVRDMKGFILQGGFCIDNFRSYDFLPNTSYTASLTKLVRRPRTLILLVGPAGVGKSSFAQQLLQQYGGGENNNNVIWWERDRIFESLRKDGIGLNKAKQMVHQNLLGVLRRKEKLESSLTAPSDNEQTKPLCSDADTAVIIVDSTNGSLDARKLYVQESSPDLVIYVSFQMDCNLSATSGDRDSQTQILDFLMSRTERRLNDNIDRHPSFPKTIPEQLIKHKNILSGIEYPTSEEVSRLNVKRSVLITCDPQDTELMAALPYKVFLEYSASAEIRHALSL
jgi:GTPase SAR1 family protein